MYFHVTFLVKQKSEGTIGPRASLFYQIWPSLQKSFDTPGLIFTHSEMQDVTSCLAAGIACTIKSDVETVAALWEHGMFVTWWNPLRKDEEILQGQPFLYESGKTLCEVSQCIHLPSLPLLLSCTSCCSLITSSVCSVVCLAGWCLPLTHSLRLQRRLDTEDPSKLSKYSPAIPRDWGALMNTMI